MMSISLLGIVLIATAASALNPGILGILEQLMAVALGKRRTLDQALWLGLCFTAGFLMTSFIVGWVLLRLYLQVPLIIAQTITLMISLVIVAVGVIEIKDYFWHGKRVHVRPPAFFINKIQHLHKRKLNWCAALWLGAQTFAFSLIAFGIPYLAILTVMRYQAIGSTILLGLFNLNLVVPLLIVVALASQIKLSRIQRWNDDSKDTMRLGTGLLLVALGWILLLMSNGVVNLG